MTGAAREHRQVPETNSQSPTPLVDDIDAEWLTGVLRSGGESDAAVVSVEREPVGAGQVGDTYRLALTYDRVDGGGPATLVAKVAAANESSREAAAAHHLYEREVRFYEHVAPRVGIRTPQCLHAAIDLGSNTFVLLLEDLAPLVTVDQIVGMTVADAELALTELARLHAPVWGDQAITDLPWLNYGKEQRDQVGLFAAPLFDTFLERYDAELEPQVSSVIRSVRDLAGAYLSHEPAAVTVVHGDYRADNMLFAACGGTIPLVVVDWQTVGSGPGLLDVAYVLGTGLAPDDRAAHEERLVRGYHDAITAAGVTGYDWAQCWDDYRRYATYAVLMLVTAAVIVERTERGDTMFLAMLRRAAAQISDLDTVSLIANKP